MTAEQGFLNGGLQTIQIIMYMYMYNVLIFIFSNYLFQALEQRYICNVK